MLPNTCYNCNGHHPVHIINIMITRSSIIIWILIFILIKCNKALNQHGISCNDNSLTGVITEYSTEYLLNITSEATYLELDICGSEHIQSYSLNTKLFDESTGYYRSYLLATNSHSTDCNKSQIFYGPLISGLYEIKLNKWYNESIALYDLTISCMNFNESIIPYDIIKCNDKITGSTIYPNDVIQYYLFHTDKNLSSIYLDSCNSDFDSDIYIFDGDYNYILYRDTGSCDVEWDLYLWQFTVSYGPIFAGDYLLLAITGFQGKTGYYEMELTCNDADNSPFDITALFVNENGTDSNQCGSEINPCYVKIVNNIYKPQTTSTCIHLILPYCFK